MTLNNEPMNLINLHCDSGTSCVLRFSLLTQLSKFHSRIWDTCTYERVHMWLWKRD